MKSHLYRTLTNTALIILSLILVYPTIGWMLMSRFEPARCKQLKATWKAEDETPHRPSYWADNWKAVRRWSQCDPDDAIKLGLDLQGGINMVLGLDQKAVNKLVADKSVPSAKYVQTMALDTIRRRVTEFQAKEPVIASMGDSEIQVELPGEKDIDRAKNLIMKTAYLTFHIVAGVEETNKVFTDINNHFNRAFVPLLNKPLRGTIYEVRPENIARVRQIVKKAEKAGLVPPDKTIAFSQKPNPWDTEKIYYIYLMGKDPVMTGDTLTQAMARTDPQMGSRWMILFTNNAAGAKKCRQVTQQNMGKAMAIVLDGVVVSAPTIQGIISTNGQITGNFNQDQARDLAIALNSGAMPVPLHEEFTGIVGASLGADSIHKGVISSIAGLACVVIFMLIYYRFAGIVANIGLFANAIMLLGTMAYFGATLTLPGIAGLILTMGMAVDANVLIYERIREELRNGKSLVAAIDAGYIHATTTIIDSNATTLIAGLVLLQFGTGPVQGFAVTLCIGIITSVYSSLIITRSVFDFFIEHGWLKKLTMMSVIPPGTKFPFIERRHIGFVVSATCIAVAIGIFSYRGSKNFGVDFTSGTTMQIKLNSEHQTTAGQVRADLAKAGFKDATVQQYSQTESLGGNQYLIRFGETQENATGSKTDTSAKTTPNAKPGANAKTDATTKPGANAKTVATTKSGADTISSRVQNALAPLCAPAKPNQVVLEQVNTVGPIVGAKLTRDAILANIYSWFFIILYLWFRFEFKFGVMAVVALIHDVLISIGALSITGRQLSMPVIAALLTIIGYSVNDTIVVFDRIREELRAYRGRGYSLMQIMNLSINETLSRTILTSMTVFFVVVVLYFFGGASLQDFAFTMIVGVITGTYSSIFIASALVYAWQIHSKTPGAISGGVKSETPNSARRRNLPKRTTRSPEKSEAPVK